MPAITVTGECGCGCGAIEFSVDSEAPRAPSERRRGEAFPIVECDARHWLMLFQRDGVLSDLEHVSGGGGGPDLRVVDPETLEPELMNG